jgi:gluconolactonase
MAVVVLDERLLELVDEDVAVEQITTGYVFTEGPVWHSRERHLTFSDIFDEHGGTQYRWSEGDGASVFRRPSNHANGSTYDRLGRLITCEHDRQLVRIHADGTVESLADHHGDARLNSPNDVIRDRHSDDLIFTDPPYGLRQPDGSIVGKEYEENAVFRYRASTGELLYLTGELETPNGLVMTDDGPRSTSRTRRTTSSTRGTCSATAASATGASSANSATVMRPAVPTG